MPYTLLQGGRRRRRRPPRAGRILLPVAVTAIAFLLFAGDLGRSDRPPPRPDTHTGAGGPAPLPRAPAPATPLDTGVGPGPRPLVVNLADPLDRVRIRFRRPPRSALLFDLDTGEVLWRHYPTRVLPIASLTKLMTALLVVERAHAGDKVRISKQALAYRGSGVGVLPRGKRVRLETLLHGLMLPSGNDAAIALAQHVAGRARRFVGMMNARARQLGLRCTRFSTPHGFTDRGNHSCAADLASLTSLVLKKRRLARIVRRRQAVLPFPIKGGRIYLYNNNPLVRQGYRGVTGVKTGYTDAAGRCLVASARRGGVRLAVVLLRSPDPGRQARQLLDRGFRVARHAG